MQHRHRLHATFTTRPTTGGPTTLDGVLAAWADAMRAPANAPVVHGDKEKPELTRQYNEGYKTDLAEPHAGPGGCDEVNEIKLWTPPPRPLLKTSSPGFGNASSGGTPASVGHSLRLRQHRREGPPPKHGLQGARAARPTLLPQDRPQRM